jgi:hypothetical protein
VAAATAAAHSADRKQCCRTATLENIMLIGILLGTPVWVWGVLAALVGVGLWQTRARTMTLARISILPLALLLLSLTGVARTFGAEPIALAGWGLGLGVALNLGRAVVEVQGARWSAATATLWVPGSWLPLALIVGLFAVKYFAAASLAMHPALAHDAAFGGACSVAYGGFSGLFLARALALRSLAVRQAARQTA